MSSTDLSREIAALVTRALGGEAIDPAAAGASLARRFPHLRLSGELIGKAVARSASMVGVTIAGSEAAVNPPLYRASEAAFWYLKPVGPAAPGKPAATRGWFARARPGRSGERGGEPFLLGDAELDNPAHRPGGPIPSELGFPAAL